MCSITPVPFSNDSSSSRERILHADSLSRENLSGEIIIAGKIGVEPQNYFTSRVWRIISKPWLPPQLSFSHRGGKEKERKRRKAKSISIINPRIRSAFSSLLLFYRNINKNIIVTRRKKGRTRVNLWKEKGSTKGKKKDEFTRGGVGWKAGSSGIKINNVSGVRFIVVITWAGGVAIRCAFVVTDASISRDRPILSWTLVQIQNVLLARANPLSMH